MSDAVESVLRKTPLFASLTDDETQALRRRVSSKHYDRGELLFSEGDACRGLFIVGKGKIRIFKLSPSGREQTLAMEGPGSSFAELPVFDGGNYPASAAASEDAEVLFISRKDFQDFCREHSEVGLKVIAVVGSRLRRLVGIIEDLSFTTVRQRLIDLILRLARTSTTRFRSIHTTARNRDSHETSPGRPACGVPETSQIAFAPPQSERRGTSAD
jgi:CRP/FNR family transcriptional regulator, cyclic AMP receptor protein